MKILLIDDDAQILDALRVALALQWPDSAVTAASDGEEGLELFFEEVPDVVLLDVSMPDKNGWEVLREIRRVSAVPVIMLTGQDGEEIGRAHV